MFKTLADRFLRRVFEEIFLNSPNLDLSLGSDVFSQSKLSFSKLSIRPDLITTFLQPLECVHGSIDELVIEGLAEFALGGIVANSHTRSNSNSSSGGIDSGSKLRVMGENLYILLRIDSSADAERIQTLQKLILEWQSEHSEDRWRLFVDLIDHLQGVMGPGDSIDPEDTHEVKKVEAKKKKSRQMFLKTLEYLGKYLYVHFKNIHIRLELPKDDGNDLKKQQQRGEKLLNTIGIMIPDLKLKAFPHQKLQETQKKERNRSYYSHSNNSELLNRLPPMLSRHDSVFHLVINSAQVYVDYDRSTYGEGSSADISDRFHRFWSEETHTNVVYPFTGDILFSLLRMSGGSVICPHFNADFGALRLSLDARQVEVLAFFATTLLETQQRRRRLCRLQKIFRGGFPLPKIYAVGGVKVLPALKIRDKEFPTDVGIPGSVSEQNGKVPSLVTLMKERLGNRWPRMMWLYAIRAVMRDLERQRPLGRWFEIARLSKQRRRYALLYVRLLRRHPRSRRIGFNAADDILSTIEYRELFEMEMSLPPATILLFRSLAYMTAAAASNLMDKDSAVLSTAKSADGKRPSTPSAAGKDISKRPSTPATGKNIPKRPSTPSASGKDIPKRPSTPSATGTPKMSLADNENRRPQSMSFTPRKRVTLTSLNIPSHILRLSWREVLFVFLVANETLTGSLPYSPPSATSSSISTTMSPASTPGSTVYDTSNNQSHFTYSSTDISGGVASEDPHDRLVSAHTSPPSSPQSSERRKHRSVDLSRLRAAVSSVGSGAAGGARRLFGSLATGVGGLLGSEGTESVGAAVGAAGAAVGRAISRGVEWSAFQDAFSALVNRDSGDGWIAIPPDVADLLGTNSAPKMCSVSVERVISLLTLLRRRSAPPVVWKPQEIAVTVGAVTAILRTEASAAGKDRLPLLQLVGRQVSSSLSLSDTLPPVGVNATSGSLAQMRLVVGECSLSVSVPTETSVVKVSVNTNSIPTVEPVAGSPLRGGLISDSDISDESEDSTHVRFADPITQLLQTPPPSVKEKVSSEPFTINTPLDDMTVSPLRGRLDDGEEREMREIVSSAPAENALSVCFMLDLPGTVSTSSVSTLDSAMKGFRIVSLKDKVIASAGGAGDLSLQIGGMRVDASRRSLASFLSPVLARLTSRCSTETQKVQQLLVAYSDGFLVVDDDLRLPTVIVSALAAEERDVAKNTSPSSRLGISIPSSNESVTSRDLFSSALGDDPSTRLEALVESRHEKRAAERYHRNFLAWLDTMRTILPRELSVSVITGPIVLQSLEAAVLRDLVHTKLRTVLNKAARRRTDASTNSSQWKTSDHFHGLLTSLLLASTYTPAVSKWGRRHAKKNVAPPQVTGAFKIKALIPAMDIGLLKVETPFPAVELRLSRQPVFKVPLSDESLRQYLAWILTEFAPVHSY